MSVFLYAGQGSQYVGMGADFAEMYPVFRQLAGDALPDFDALRLMREGPEEQLRDTRYTQPCMALFAAGVTRVLADSGILPDAACGLSLGEYGAVFAAGVWDARTYIRLTAFRGEAMAEAAAGRTAVMCAILNAEREAVEEACRRVRESGGLTANSSRFVRLVNDNAPGQVVICGDEESIGKTETLLRENPRIRTLRLNTAAPFHTPLLTPAAEALRTCFASVSFQQPRIPVAMNVTGRLLAEGEDIRELLAEQVCQPVRFREDLTALLESGAEDFLEIGPGDVLSGLCRKTARSLGKKVRIRSIQTAEDLRTVIQSAGS